MNRAPKPEVIFERLLNILKLERSEFVPEMKTSNGARPDQKSYKITTTPAHMTRGLTLHIQHFDGDRQPLRIQVATHTGEGTGEGNILYSCGAREFAEKVWAIEAGINAAKALGVKVGDL